jgi:AcrR family transcriptional regulator
MKHTVRDAQATQARILEAAMAEFSAYGLAGGRVDRIAVASDANKNSIYRYFGSKDGLFGAVLRHHLERIYTEVPFTPDDLPGFAGRLFDFGMAHPDVMRLLAWYGLEHDPQVAPPGVRSMDQKLQTLAGMQHRQVITADFPPAFLMVVISSLAAAWTVVNPFLHAIDPPESGREAEIRGAIQRAVSRILAP